jgi:hypothetical protein
MGGGGNSQPFITVYNPVWKNGANSAMEILTFGNAHSGVNRNVLYNGTNSLGLTGLNTVMFCNHLLIMRQE